MRVCVPVKCSCRSSRCKCNGCALASPSLIMTREHQASMLVSQNSRNRVAFKWTEYETVDENKLLGTLRTEKKKAPPPFMRCPFFPFFQDSTCEWNFVSNPPFLCSSLSLFIGIKCVRESYKMALTEQIFHIYSSHHKNVEYTPISMLNLIFRIAYDWF